MLVLAEIEGGEAAIRAARRHHRNLAREADEALQHRRLAADRLKSLGQVRPGQDLDLALAVIAEAARLQHARPPQRRDRGLEIGQRIHRAEGRHRQPLLGDEALLAQPVLRHRQRMRARMQRLAGREEGRRRRRHILEFIGHDVDGLGEARQRRLVLVRRHRLRRRHVEGRVLRLGREDMAGDAEIGRGERDHPGELAAADDAEHGAGRQRLTLDHRRAHASSFTGRSAIAALWRAR